MAESADGKARGGMMPSILAIIVLTLIGGGGGAGFAYLVLPDLAPSPASASPGEGPAGSKPDGSGPAGSEAEPSGAAVAGEAGREEARPTTAGLSLVALEPVYTNLYAPDDVWVRLEASLLVDREAAEDGSLDTRILAAEVEADTLAFLRSVQLPQLAGSRGLMHLADDLRTRARMRSPAVRDYLIRVMVAE